MSFDTLSILRGELDAGEKLLWSGKPKGGLRLKRSDAFLIPFSLVWGGFAFVWEVLALATVPEDSGLTDYAFPLFGVPFVIIGIYLIFGRFIYDAIIRSKTVYALTNKRIIFVVGNASKTVRSFKLSNLGDVSYYEKNDGSGSITFNTRINNYSYTYKLNNHARRKSSSSVNFELIEKVKEVYMLYRQQLDRLDREDKHRSI